MIRDTNTSGVPIELASAARDHHKGLRVVELLQHRGRSAYQLVERFLLVTKENEPPAHDEHPNEDPRSIAEQLWTAACALRRKGGDQRLAAKFYTATEKGELQASELCKFDVPLEELLEQGGSGKDVEAVARANFIDSLVAYSNRLHGVVGELGDKLADGVTKMFNAQTNTIGKVAEMLPRLLEMRMDAAEAEVRALVSELRASTGKSSEDWKEAGKNFVEVAKGPVGAAMAAKLLGIDPKDAAAFFAQFGGDAPSSTTTTATGSLRDLITQLGNSLTESQKATLLAGLGLDALQHLQTAQRATDEATCRDATRKFFVALGEDDSPRWKCIETTLSDEQKMLILQAVELINPAAKPS